MNVSLIVFRFVLAIHCVHSKYTLTGDKPQTQPWTNFESEPFGYRSDLFMLEQIAAADIPNARSGRHKLISFTPMRPNNGLDSPGDCVGCSNDF